MRVADTNSFAFSLTQIAGSPAVAYWVNSVDEVRYMDSHAGCGFVSGRVRLAARDGSSLGIPEEPVVETDHYLNLLRSCYIWTPSAVMFRTSVLKSAGGFAPGRSGAADWDRTFDPQTQFSR